MIREEFDEDFIAIEAEELADSIFAMGYYDLTPELRLWLRFRAIEALWPDRRSIEPSHAELARMTH